MRNLKTISRTLTNSYHLLKPKSQIRSSLNPPFSQTLKPSFTNHNLIWTPKLYSSDSQSNPIPNPKPNSPNPEPKHQEIEGPTVDRDLSPLANETRDVTLRLMKTMSDITTPLALLGLSHLAFGAWTAYSQPHTTWVSTISSVIAFGFPFSMAFMLRHSLKSMHFLNKMEQIGRLQILTSTMQISKHLHMFFVRLRVIAYFSVAGLPLAFCYSLLSNSSSVSS